MPIISLPEILLVVSTAVVIIAYHTHLYIKIRKDPLSTATGITNHARQMWVRGVIRDKHDILVVQTLRNQVMASTFLASTAILISLGSFSAAFRPVDFGEISHGLNVLGTKTEYYRYAWVLSVGSHCPVAVRSDVDVGRQSHIGCCRVSPGP